MIQNVSQNITQPTPLQNFLHQEAQVDNPILVNITTYTFIKVKRVENFDKGRNILVEYECDLEYHTKYEEINKFHKEVDMPYSN